MQFKHTTLGLAVFASLFGTSAAIAQDDIETISVIGARQPIELSRLSASVSVIDRAEIENSGAISLSDLLRGLPGVSISQDGVKGSQTQVRLRGSEANHVLVLVDGVEVNDLGADGGVNFAHLNLDNVQRIELLRGPQSALWGSAAVGGVISITTREAQGKLQGSSKLEVGQDSSKRLAGSLQGQSESLSYALAANHFSTKGQNIARTGEERDGYRNNEVSAKLGWLLSDASKVLLQYRNLDTFNEYDGSDYTTGLSTDADNFTHGRFASGKLEWHFAPANSAWSQTLGVQHSRNNSINYSPAFGGDAQYQQSEVDSNKQRWFWQNNLSYGQANRASLVLEHVNEDFEQIAQAQSWGDPNQQQDNHTNSIAADILHQLNDSLTLTASVRHDNNQIFDDALTYRIGGTFDISAEYSLFVSHGKAVKNPSFIERFGYTPASFIGNSHLEPEESSSSEVGLRANLSAGWQTELSIYHTDLENEINGYVFDTELGGATAKNIVGESARDGLEWQLSGQLANLSVDLSYSYLDAREEDGQTNKIEVRRARHSANLVLNYPFFDNKANIYLQANYQGTRQDDFFATFPATRVALSAATIVNAALTFRPDQHWTFAVRAENLFDHEYEEVVGYQRQGRTAYLSAGYQF
ncbi:TonB-dependent receptor domain-containing protein [Bowmanella denitrificans]|uniref:TonB-dependent receptor domain-containing protein n=1 Tax=Bowmanella denitrificans TaxID=366582 RepID=UPI000C99EEF4|nr:TonB-dependent receptor [Bowmanella denitrificans]